ncbi:type VII secretion integral membrane protein EccD [Mycobacterium sp. M1]|uniref:Type VII secretion integral membrane protein EccD n=1 Tax=Mycolicibacter acidiphilus TaxID=2835306 RepID=A0ABS5RP46_9MYCO|nr:type VII secretion integral membrane protein EccD [Mycolicibacter acidiphilus]
MHQHHGQRAGVDAGDRVHIAEQVRVAVLFDGRQTDVTLPASVAVVSVVDTLLRVLDIADDEGVVRGARRPDADGMVTAGVLTLTRIDGRPLDRSRNLVQQNVVDGDLLILKVVDTEVEFTPIVEAPSSAVAVLSAAAARTVDENTARVVAAAAAVASALVATAVLAGAWWRSFTAGQDWNVWPAVLTGVLAVGLLGGGVLVRWLRRDDMVATTLWVTALVVAPVSALMVAPGRPSVWHVMAAAVVAAGLSGLLWRVSSVARAVVVWVCITGAATWLMALVHSLGVTLFYLWVVALALALVVLVNASTIAAMMAAIPVPPFPTVTGKDTFDDADHIAADALVAAEHSGTPSVARLAQGAAMANTYLTAVVAATVVFFVGGAIGAGIPGDGRWKLATIFVVIVAIVLVLRGRAFAARGQAVTVVVTGLVMLVIVAVKYTVFWAQPVVAYVVAGLVVGLGLLALMVVAVVPARVISPVFRKAVEWAEYVLITSVLPITLWLCNVYYLARNH